MCWRERCAGLRPKCPRRQQLGTAAGQPGKPEVANLYQYSASKCYGMTENVESACKGLCAICFPCA